MAHMGGPIIPPRRMKKANGSNVPRYTIAEALVRLHSVRRLPFSLHLPCIRGGRPAMCTLDFGQSVWLSIVVELTYHQLSSSSIKDRSLSKRTSSQILTGTRTIVSEGQSHGPERVCCLQAQGRKGKDCCAWHRDRDMVEVERRAKGGQIHSDLDLPQPSLPASAANLLTDPPHLSTSMP